MDAPGACRAREETKPKDLNRDNDKISTERKRKRSSELQSEFRMRKPPHHRAPEIPEYFLRTCNRIIRRQKEVLIRDFHPENIPRIIAKLNKSVAGSVRVREFLIVAVIIQGWGRTGIFSEVIGSVPCASVLAG